MDFKVGQTVELVDNSGIAADKGATAVIIQVKRSYIVVKWKTHSNDQMDGGYSPNTFKLVLQKGEQLLFSFME